MSQSEFQHYKSIRVTRNPIAGESVQLLTQRVEKNAVQKYSNSIQITIKSESNKGEELYSDERETFIFGPRKLDIN